jgi:hypothetical protein
MRLALTRGRAASAVLAASMVAVGLVGLAQSSQAASTYTISPKTGPGGGAAPAKIVTVAGTGFKSATGVVQPTAVVYVATGTACTAGATAVTAFTVPTATQVVVTMPAALALGTSNAKKDYTICVYNGATLLGSGKYTVYPIPAITGFVAPVKGSVSGGGTIAVAGTGFTATSVVKFGSVKATGVKVASDGTSLTAKIPAQSAGAVAVSVTTEGGTNPTPATGTWDDFTYANSVAVSPSTGVGGADVLTVKGVGFDALAATFATTSKVYLALGQFAPASLPTEICGSVQVISDTELVCTLDGTVADGAYSVVVVGNNTDATTSAASDTDLSSTASYLVADF